MAGKNDKGMSSAELSSFCGQVALILEAGLPLYDGMRLTAGARMRRCIRRSAKG